MPQCTCCQGVGTIAPASPLGLPMKCYRCAGTGEIEWEDLRPGDHVCYLYDDPAEQLRNITKFLAAGLPQGERILYVYEHHTPAQLDAALAEHGVDVAKERARGAILYFSKNETYLAGGTFEPQSVIDRWRDILKRSLAEGYTGIRGAGEATWALDSHAHCRELINYELMCDLFFLAEQPRITGICQYDRKRFPGAIIQGAELAHRLVFHD